MAETTIQAALATGRVPVSATIVGHFAVHRPLDLQLGRKWVITHIATGMLLGGYWFGSRAKAIACAEEIQRRHNFAWGEEQPVAMYRYWARALVPILSKRSDGEMP